MKVGQGTPVVYVQDILTAISKIEQRIAGMDKTAFARDEVIQDSVIRQLEIIGEAVKSELGKS